MVLLELARRAARGLLAWRRPAVLVPVLAGMLGAAAAVGLFARQDARVGPLTVRLAARPSLHPSSMLMVPPFGSVSARTHLGLLAFRATLDNVDVPSLERLIRRYAKGDDQSLDSLQAALAPYERRARAATGISCSAWLRWACSAVPRPASCCASVRSRRRSGA